MLTVTFMIFDKQDKKTPRKIETHHQFNVHYTPS